LGKIEELYDKRVKCSVCNKEFITKKVRTSKLILSKRDSDFLSYYKGENPIKYNVFVCPYCGYSAVEENFNDINVNDKDVILEKVSSNWNWNKRKFSGRRSIGKSIEAYKLALYCGQILKLKKYDLANICLKIGWLYRAKEDIKEENRFLNLAKTLYSEAYYKESLKDGALDELTLIYLLGEISRRLGEKEEALKWFNIALKNPRIKDNIAIERLTREQWQLTKES